MTEGGAGALVGLVAAAVSGALVAGVLVAVLAC